MSTSALTLRARLLVTSAAAAMAIGVPASLLLPGSAPRPAAATLSASVTKSPRPAKSPYRLAAQTKPINHPRATTGHIAPNPLASPGSYAPSSGGLLGLGADAATPNSVSGSTAMPSAQATASFALPAQTAQPATSSPTTASAALPSNPQSLPISGTSSGVASPVAAQPGEVAPLFQSGFQSSGGLFNTNPLPSTANTGSPQAQEMIGLIHTYFPPQEWANATAVSNCESGLNPTRVSVPNSNGTRDWGAFQLNDGGTLQNLLIESGLSPLDLSQALNPVWNTQSAYLLWTQRGWQPWTCATKLGIAPGA